MSTSSEYVATKIWSTWTSDITTTGTCSTSTASDITWSTWVSSDATSWTSTSTAFSDNQDQVWSTWTSDTTDNVVYSEARFSNPVYHWKDRRTTEEKRAQKAQQEIEREWRRIKAQELQEEKKQAELTAQALLEDLIDEEQMRIYKESGNLVIYGEKYDYVLRRIGGVIRVEKGKVKPLVRKLCIHLREKYKYPETDNVIALKLFLESDEEAFLDKANKQSEIDDPERREEILKLVGTNKNRAA